MLNFYLSHISLLWEFLASWKSHIWKELSTAGKGFSLFTVRIKSFHKTFTICLLLTRWSFRSMLLLVLSVGYSDTDGCCCIWMWTLWTFPTQQNTSRVLLQRMLRPAPFWHWYQLKLLLLLYWHERLNDDVVNQIWKISWLFFSWTISLPKHLGWHNK